MMKFIKLCLIVTFLACLLLVASFYLWANEVITGEETKYDEYNDDYYFHL